MNSSEDIADKLMDPSSIVDVARRTSEALRALSHEHRLLILGILARSERSVGELEKILRLPQPAVSQQLARLRLDNLVTCRRDGRTIYYSLASQRVREICADLQRILGDGSDAAAEPASSNGSEENPPLPPRYAQVV